MLVSSLHAKLLEKARFYLLVERLIGPSTHRGILFSLQIDHQAKGRLYLMTLESTYFILKLLLERILRISYFIAGLFHLQFCFPGNDDRRYCLPFPLKTRSILGPRCNHLDIVLVAEDSLWGLWVFSLVSLFEFGPGAYSCGCFRLLNFGAEIEPLKWLDGIDKYALVGVIPAQGIWRV